MSTRNRIYGFAGLAAALVAAFADLELQYTNIAAHIGSHQYAYLLDVPVGRITIGHFLGVPAVLAEIAGFWFVSRALVRGKGQMAALFFWCCVTTFALGAAFHAMFAPIGLALARARDSGVSDQILRSMAAAVRPVHQNLGLVVLVGMLIYSLLFLAVVASGKSAYPRWLALASPFVFVLCMIPLTKFYPQLRAILVPCVLNLANAFLFTACIIFGPRQAQPLNSPH